MTLDRTLTSLRAILRKPLPGILLWTIAAFSSPVQSQSFFTIYFYNPEITTARNEVLKNTIDSFLKQQGAFQFQPVSQAEIFEQVIKTERQALFIMPSWHFEQLEPTKASLVAHLRGVKNEAVTFRKILVAKTPKALKQLTIASSGTVPYSLATLSTIFPEEPADTFSSSNILVVPKDIDALLAVGFDLADAAIATESSLAKLSNLYATTQQPLQIIGKSAPIKRMVVVGNRSKNTIAETAITALQAMKMNKKGKIALRMLGLDDWQALHSESAERERSQK